MDIACQRGQIADILDMGFLVQYRLIEVCNAPALGNVELEQIREFLCCLLRSWCFAMYETGRVDFRPYRMPYSRASWR